MITLIFLLFFMIAAVTGTLLVQGYPLLNGIWVFLLSSLVGAIGSVLLFQAFMLFFLAEGEGLRTAGGSDFRVARWNAHLAELQYLDSTWLRIYIPRSVAEATLIYEGTSCNTLLQKH